MSQVGKAGISTLPQGNRPAPCVAEETLVTRFGPDSTQQERHPQLTAAPPPKVTAPPQNDGVPLSSAQPIPELFPFSRIWVRASPPQRSLP